MTATRRFMAAAICLVSLLTAIAFAVHLERLRFVEPKSDAVQNIEIETSEGRRFSTSAFRGRYILLNIWATWCPPCVKEMPSLDRLQRTKGSTSFEVVALSVDRSGKDVVEPFFKRAGLTDLTIYLDQGSKSMSAFKVIGLPTTLLIDPKGREISRWLGPREWDHEDVIRDIDALVSKAASR